MSECILWTRARDHFGYGHFWDGQAKRFRLAHRVAWEEANGRPIPEGLIIRHACDVPACVNPDHLELGTMQDNSRDMMKRGRGRGQFQPNQGVTLTVDDVRAIRAEWTGRYGQASELGRRYGVHRSTVLRIAKGEARRVA